MGARILTLVHFILTFTLAVIIAVGFASNNWVEGRFIKSSHTVLYTSGLFLGCMNFPNKSSLCSRKIIYGSRGGLILTVLAAMLNFFLSCVYSVKATKIVIGVFVIGCKSRLISAIITTMGVNIMYVSYRVDRYNSNPEIDISMGLGMILAVIGIFGILSMAVLLSVTLLSVERAKIQDKAKTAELVNRATIMTLSRAHASSSMQGRSEPNHANQTLVEEKESIYCNINLESDYQPYSSLSGQAAKRKAANDIYV